MPVTVLDLMDDPEEVRPHLAALLAQILGPVEALAGILYAASCITTVVHKREAIERQP